MRVVAVAGIARPQRFFDALRAQGYDIVREFAFRDHHWFSARDIAAIEHAARDAGADAIVTTDKDLARLDGGAGQARPAWLSLPMQIAIEPPGLFRDWLTARLLAARARRGVAA
jgi:tetraacyldisaccharide 4'-kinase